MTITQKQVEFTAQITSAKDAIGEALQEGIGQPNAKMFLENAIAYLQNAKKITTVVSKSKKLNN